MTNYFRQLTLPWLIALSLMLLFTALWYHYESKIMQRAIVQQFTSSLQFSIRPLLDSKNPDLLKAQLNHLRYASVLPVSTIAIYSGSGRLISGTEKATLLTQFKSEQLQHEFQLLHEAGSLIAVQPVSSAARNGYEEIINTQNDDYYVVVELEAADHYSVWLVPVLVVAILGWATWLIVHGAVSRGAQRQQTDISLLVHKLSQLKQGQLNSRLDDEIDSELTPLKTAVNDLAEQQLHNRSRDDMEKNLLNQQIAEVIQSLTNEKQQSVQLQSLYEQSQMQQQQQLSHLRQLVQQQSIIPEQQLKRALHSQLMLAELTLASEPAHLAPLRLTEYLGQQLPNFHSIVAERNVTLQLTEAPDNALYQLTLPENLLTMLLISMLRLNSHSEEVTELTLTMQLKVSGKVGNLLLSVTGNGDGLLTFVRQQLTNPEQQSSHWQSIDSQIITQIAAKLGVTVDVQSLEGLGSTVSVRLPLLECEPVQVERLNHVLLFDPQLIRLEERKAALGSLVSSVTQCADLSELQLKIKQYHFDAVLIFLPEPTDLALWLELIQTMQQKTRVLCYAGTDCIQMWREALGIVINEEPFCLAQLQQIEVVGAAKLAKLLVVDDNPTNLAFIEVLVKNQPLELSTANCARQAMQLCAEQQFDVILLDIQLPDMLGTEVAKQLRQMKAYQLTPILAFTAHALADEVASFKAAGMNDVIFKPLEASKLQLILQWCLSAKTNNSSQ